MNTHTHFIGFRAGESRLIRFAGETPREEAPQPAVKIERMDTPDQVQNAAGNRVAEADKGIVTRFEQLRAQEQGMRALGTSAEQLQGLTGGLRGVLEQINKGANDTGFNANKGSLTRMGAQVVEDLSQQGADALKTHIEKPLGDAAASAAQAASARGQEINELQTTEKQKMNQAAANLEAMNALPADIADLVNAPLEMTTEPVSIPNLPPMPEITPIPPVETPDLAIHSPAPAAGKQPVDDVHTMEEAAAILEKNLNRRRGGAAPAPETGGQEPTPTMEDAKAILDRNLNNETPVAVGTATESGAEAPAGNETTDELSDIVGKMEKAKGLDQLKYLLEAITKLLEQLAGGLGKSPEAKSDGSKDKPATGTESVAEQLNERSNDGGADLGANVEGLKKEKQETLDRNKEQIGSLDKDVKGLKDKNNTLIGERSALEQQMNNLRGDETAAEQVKSLQTQLDALSTQIDANTKAIDSIDAQHDNLVNQNKALEGELKTLNTMGADVTAAGEMLKTLLNILPEGNKPEITMKVNEDGSLGISVKGIDANVTLPEGAVREADGSVTIRGEVTAKAPMAQIRNNMTETADKPAEKLTEADMNALTVRAEADLADLTNTIHFQGPGVSVNQQLAKMNEYLGNVHTRLPEGRQMFELRLGRQINSPTDNKDYLVRYNERSGKLEVTSKEDALKEDQRAVVDEQSTVITSTLDSAGYENGKADVEGAMTKINAMGIAPDSDVARDLLSRTFHDQGSGREYGMTKKADNSGYELTQK